MPWCPCAHERGTQCSCTFLLSFLQSLLRVSVSFVTGSFRFGEYREVMWHHRGYRFSAHVLQGSSWPHGVCNGLLCGTKAMFLQEKDIETGIGRRDIYGSQTARGQGTALTMIYIYGTGVCKRRKAQWPHGGALCARYGYVLVCMRVRGPYTCEPGWHGAPTSTRWKKCFCAVVR